ncbi:MAG: hypothetical protein V9G19_16750 [Tetrasphaera sp.]
MTTRLEAALRGVRTPADLDLPDDLAATAWTAGERRRLRARAAALAGVVGAFVLVVAVVGGLPGGTGSAPPVGADSAPGAHAYPRRIGPALVPPRMLPDAPGPLAGIFKGVVGWPWQRDPSSPQAWFGFDAEGHVWRLPHPSRVDSYPRALR